MIGSNAWQLIQKDVDKAIILQCLRYIVQQDFFGQAQQQKT